MSKFKNITLYPSVAPTTPRNGMIYNDSTVNKLKIYLNGSWLVLDGDNGREVELQKTSTHLQWRYIGDTSWINLLSLSELQPTAINASIVVEDSTHRFVTDNEKVDWNNKESLKFIPDVQPDDIFRGYTYQQNSTSVISNNIAISSAQGTVTARSVSSTNILTKQVRMAYAVSTPAMNQQCGVRIAQALWSIGGGFKFVITFAHTDSQYNSGARQFYGMTSSTALLGINSTVTVASLTNVIGIGSDAGDAELSIYCNDANGSATKVPLSSVNFPANRTAGSTSADIFSFELYNAIGSTEVKYRVTNLTNGVQEMGTLTTDLPSTTTMLSFQGIRTSGSSSNACSFDVTKIGCYNLA